MYNYLGFTNFYIENIEKKNRMNSELLTLKRSLQGLCNRLSVCLSVWMSVTPLLQHLRKHMSKRNKGNRPERQLAALAKQDPRTSVYI